MPFRVKFNVFRVSLGCVICRAISGGSSGWQPVAGAEAAARVPETDEPRPCPRPRPQPPRRPGTSECPRSTSRGSYRSWRRERREGGSALGNCEGQFRRAGYLYSLPMFMSCPVRHCTRSCCVGAIQDYLLGHVWRAAPGGWLLSAFYISL